MPSWTKTILKKNSEGCFFFFLTMFFQVLCHHSACLVLFHKKYGYGKIEKEFEKFAQLLAEQPSVLVGEIGTTGEWEMFVTD